MKVFFLFILAGFVGLFAFAAVYKYLEVRMASRWLSVAGRVVSSRVVQRKTGSIGDEQKDAELRNFAEVIYAYEVRGRKLRGDRVSIAEDPGNFQVAETLAKYPAGTDVIVYYNPLKPAQAVLEREVPEGAFHFMALFIAALLAAGVATILGIETTSDWLKAVLPARGNTPAAVFLAIMAAATFMIARAAGAEAKSTKTWQSASGVIEQSGVESFTTNDEQRLVTRKRTAVVYRYTVNGNEYRSSRIAVRGWKASSNISALVGWQAKKYPPGKQVEVFFNPANPAEAVLERRVAGGVLIYLIGGLLLLGAVKAAGFF